VSAPAFQPDRSYHAHFHAYRQCERSSRLRRPTCACTANVFNSGRWQMSGRTFAVCTLLLCLAGTATPRGYQPTPRDTSHDAYLPDTLGDIARNRQPSRTAADRQKVKLAQMRRDTFVQKKRSHEALSLERQRSDRLERSFQMRLEKSKQKQLEVTRHRAGVEPTEFRPGRAVKNWKESIVTEVASMALNVSDKDAVVDRHLMNELSTSHEYFVHAQTRPNDTNQASRTQYYVSTEGGRPATASRYRWSLYDRRETQACPAHCSGHGTCRIDKCVCSRNWHGVDCSRRKCPAGPALVDQDSTRVYAYAECSGRGTCDAASGTCDCLPGYEGRTCSRSACSSHDCHGHGKCTQSLGTTSGVGCVCDPPYYGPDCYLLPCPTGDDAMTFPLGVDGAHVQYLRAYNVHEVSISATRPDVTGFFTLSYTGPRNIRHETRPIPWHTYHRLGDEASRLEFAVRVRKSLLSLPDYLFPDVLVNVTAATNGIAFLLTFSRESGNMTGFTVNIAGCDHVGCQPRYIGLHTMGMITVTTNETYRTSNVENVECSNHGICHPTTGTCTCDNGWHGPACENELCRDL
jgi:hypothetical protein